MFHSSQVSLQTKLSKIFFTHRMMGRLYCPLLDWRTQHTSPVSIPTDFSRMMVSLKHTHRCRSVFGSHHVVDVEDDGFTGHSSVQRASERERSAVLSEDVERVQDGGIVSQRFNPLKLGVILEVATGGDVYLTHWSSIDRTGTSEASGDDEQHEHLDPPPDDGHHVITSSCHYITP